MSVLANEVNAPPDNVNIIVPEPTAALTYFADAVSRLEELRRTQTENIQKAAELCADRISKGGLVFLFGNGHSRMMCEEMTPRQGCFPGFVALVELALSNHASIVGANGLRAPLHLEKYEGYAEEILKGFKFGPHDAMIVVSTSRPPPRHRRNGHGRARSAASPSSASSPPPIAATPRPATPPGRSSSTCADIVIDNQCPPGDCMLELPGLEWRTGPASTVTGGMIINMIRCATAEGLLARGMKPVLLPSHQFVGNTGAAAQLEEFYEAYRKSLRHLFE